MSEPTHKVISLNVLDVFLQLRQQLWCTYQNSATKMKATAILTPFDIQDDDNGLEKLGKKGGATGEDFENELQSSVSAFEALERDFQEVQSYG